MADDNEARVKLSIDGTQAEKDIERIGGASQAAIKELDALGAALDRVNRKQNASVSSGSGARSAGPRHSAGLTGIESAQVDSIRQLTQSVPQLTAMNNQLASSTALANQKLRKPQG